MLPQRRLGNLALTGLLRFVARAPIGDGQSGFRALSRAAAAEAEIVHDYNYAQVLTLDLLAKRHRYLEVPIGYRFRTTVRSFVRPLRYLRQVVAPSTRPHASSSRPRAPPARTRASPTRTRASPSRTRASPTDPGSGPPVGERSRPLSRAREAVHRTPSPCSRTRLSPRRRGW